MTKVKITALCIPLIALAGCQSFPFHFGAQDRATATTPDMTSYFAQRLHDGKRHLEAYRLAAAIDAFRQSSYHPDYAGEAFNGMAIAYDRLGRYDLAESYFNRAVEAAPEDPRFARNASRFETRMLARRGATPDPVLDQSQPQVELAEADLQMERIAEVVEAELGAAPTPRMQRVSAREVTLASRDDWSARVATEGPSRPAVVHVGRATIDSQRLAAAGPSPRYPVYFALTDIPNRRTPTEIAQRPQGSPFSTGDGEVRVRVSGKLRPQDRPVYPISFRLDPPS